MAQFETERLFLRQMDTSDAAFLVAVMNTPKWLKFIGDRNVRSEQDGISYITDRVLSQYERLGFSNFTVIRKSDGAKIGVCGLYDRPGLDGIDIGFAFLPEYEGQGYGFEAANVVKDAAMNLFKLEKLVAITSKENVASQRLLEKIGLKPQGAILLPGETEEVLYYEL
jgi:RimJ/RimL family protein N-acetyltransferase